MVGARGFTFVVNADLCEGNYVAIDATTPDGKVAQLWAEVELTGRVAVLRQFAIYGANVGPRKLGAASLRGMARAAMEEFDVDCIRIEEARRTSGSVPGRIVETIEFRRRAR